MIVVTFALPAESSAFIRLLRNITRDGAVVRGELKYGASLRAVGSTKPEANIEHRTSKVCVLHTGVGAARCEERLGNFLRNETPELLIASGFCGGTQDEMRPGDLVIADNASDLSKKAHAILPGAVVGKIHSADRIIDPAVDRYKIGREHGAIAIDMETGTITRLCAARSIPLLALRVVSDSPVAPFPMSPKVFFDIEKHRVNFFLLLSYIVRNPLSIIRLTQFARQIAHAKTKLAAALCAVLAAL